MDAKGAAVARSLFSKGKDDKPASRRLLSREELAKLKRPELRKLAKKRLSVVQSGSDADLVDRLVEHYEGSAQIDCRLRILGKRARLQTMRPL